MKSKFTKFALAAALGLALAFTFTACGKGGGDVKLLESDTWLENDITAESKRVFEYDEQNRIVKISYYPSGEHKTIIYSADGSVTVENGSSTEKFGTEKFVVNGNIITAENSYYKSLAINKDGYIVKSEVSYWSSESEYKGGNLIGEKGRSLDGTRTSQCDYLLYDDKKSPFSNCKTPKWLIQILLTDISAGKNNVLNWNCDSINYAHKYEYNSEGFPTKLTDIKENRIKLFTYRGETQNTAATPPQTEAKPAEKASGSTLTDPRDNKTYKTVKIGTQTWMAENLNFETKEGSMCQEENLCKVFGRLYDWETALKVCPKGWHLSSNEEWQTLVNFAGGKETAGKKLKAEEGWTTYSECQEYEDECDGECGCLKFGEAESGNGTDDYGFQALPGGWCCGDTGYGDVSWGYYGYWWSSSKGSSTYVSILSYRSDDIDVSGLKRGDWHSVRCIQN